MAEPKIPYQYETVAEAQAAGAASPAEAVFNAWAKTAKPGDVFDWEAETGFQPNIGIKSKFAGYNEQGKPIYETLQSEARTNWRNTIGNTAGMSTEDAVATAVSRLKAAGFADDMAKFLASRKLGMEAVYGEDYDVPKPMSIGAMADGRPIYGFDASGNPVTDPNGSIYSTTSSADAVARYQSGSAPLFGPAAPAGVVATPFVATTATTSPRSMAFTTQGSTNLNNPYEPGSDAYKAFEERKSAYNLMLDKFSQYGLSSLVEPLKNLVIEGVSPSEFTIRLRETDAYKKRFGANQQRINKGLRALSEAEYLTLEDQYQDVMRRYGLPESYYKRGDMGRQEGFEKFISLDVSPVELEDRVQTAYDRVINANPEVGIALRNFYPGISNGDILAYALDPEKALDQIKRKITAAEIGGAAVQSGLTTNESDAEYLARYGITKEQAQQGYRTISGYLPRAEQLSSIYGKQFEGGPYTQASAEREVFNVPGAAAEQRKREKITSLEQAAFSGSSGLTGSALSLNRAGQF